MGMRADLRVDRRRSTVHRNLWARPASIVFVLHRTALREELEAAVPVSLFLMQQDEQKII